MLCTVLTSTCRGVAMAVDDPHISGPQNVPTSFEYVEYVVYVENVVDRIIHEYSIHFNISLL
jgi:hypothetical protein